MTSDHDLRHVAVELLHAELQRRQDESSKPACGSTGKQGTYNVPIHVFAVFLILIISTIGECDLFQIVSMSDWVEQHVPFPSSHDASLHFRFLTDSSSCQDTSGLAF